MIGILITTFIGFIISIILVNVDAYLDDKGKREKKFIELLPGYNCGACGFNSCDGMAEAMLEKIDNYLKCKPMNLKQKEEIEAYLRKSKLI